MKKILLTTVLTLATLTSASWVFAQNIVTGDATSITVICNDVNNNTGPQPCNPTATPPPTGEPTPTPTPPVETPTPTQPAPTPSPTSPPSGGDGRQPGGGGEAGIGGAPVSVPTPQGEVLGLAAASGEGWDALLFYALGSLCVTLGGKLVTGKRFIFA